MRRTNILLATILTTVSWLLAGPALSAAADDLLPADRPLQQVIDHYVDAVLAHKGVEPAPVADEANVIRRTMLDLVGRAPTVPELQAYLDSDQADKRVRLVDRLMQSPGFVRHQVRQFNTMLMYGNSGSLADYLRGAFEENRGWDAIVRDLLLAAGSETAPQGAEQFIKARVQDLDKLTNDASVAFFGVNVSCAKCHDHPLVPNWTQNHFYGMKSFFSRTFANGDFVAERDYGTVSYKTTDGESRDARLMFLTGTMVEEPPAKTPSDAEMKAEKKRLDELKKNKQPPPAPAFSRRAQLAEIALRDGQRDYLARAVVNKLWYRFYGQGLVMPVDQMHPENPPSHPELMEWLSRDLVTHAYGLRRLIRGLVLSQTYARASRWPVSERPDPQLFAVAQVRPLSPYQYATSLRLAATSPDVFADAPSDEELDQRIEGIERSAGGLAGLLEQPVDDFQVGVTEALLFSNSERVRNELLRDARDSLVGKLKTIEDHRELIDTAVLTVFNRHPDEEELSLLESYLVERADRPLQARQQLVWSLLTSSECRFNY